MKEFSEEVATSVIHFSLISGGIGFIVGLIQILMNLSDPSALGPAAALSLLTVLYSIILSAIIFAIKKKVEVKNLGIISSAAATVTILPILLIVFSFKM